MRFTLSSLGIFLLLILASCSIKHNYIWNEYPIAPGRISSEVNFDSGQEINIIKGTSNTEQMFLGNVGAHKYFGTEQSLTDGLVDQLAMEMRKRGIKINPESNKSIEIAVVRTVFERGMFKIAVTMDYTVKFGNGEIKTFSTRNSSPATVDKTYDGVVALAVIELIQDADILEYLEN